MLRQLINFLEGLQGKINLEGYFLLGVELDRWAHFIIAFLVVTVFIKLKKPKTGIIIVVVLALLKEMVDLGIIYYYEPVVLKFWLDSIYDVLLGFLGIATSLLVFRRSTRY